MKIMTRHTSATARKPHVTQTSTPNLSKAIKRRAEAVVRNRTIDAQSRAIIRYGLETNDPWLTELVSRAGAGERISDSLDFSQTSVINKDDSSSREKIEALAEIICRVGDESAAALLVLMGTLENSAQPKVLAHTAKHFAFTRCGELNLFGIVDAQIAVLEGELLAGNTLVS
jgi:hypothetical protein